MGVPETLPLASRWGLIFFALVVLLFQLAYRFRVHHIEAFGPIIHDSSPQFNYRAAEYLLENGWQKFFTWFDDMAFYPFGRPVCTTIYPGLQITAVILKKTFLKSWSIVALCCYIPAWFGGVGSMLVGMIAYEVALSQERPPVVGTPLLAVASGVIAMGMMAIIPAHLLSCIGGKFDNESVALSAMLATFCCWIRSLRNDNGTSNLLFSVVAGVSYFYLAATWRGHIFTLNMIGLHAAASVPLGRFSQKMYMSFSLFYVVGTALAIQIPVVGWTPFTSLEQLGPCLVFLKYQELRLCQVWMGRRQEKLSQVQRLQIYFRVFFLSLLLLGIAVAVMYQQGILERYLTPIQTRVWMLLTSKQTSGNALVDSVTEQVATEIDAYRKYLGIVGIIAPFGLFQTALFRWKKNDATSFLVCWGVVTYVFSQRMSRLVILVSPIACVLAALFVSRLMLWSAHELLKPTPDDGSNLKEDKNQSTPTAQRFKQKKRGSKQKQNETTRKQVKTAFAQDSDDEKEPLLNTAFETFYHSKEGEAIKRFLSLLIPIMFLMLSEQFYSDSLKQVPELSNSVIVYNGQQKKNGEVVTVRDFIESSEWLRENTPSDARVLAWWPHGYRIAAIANRTTLADGNTWSHDHLALLAKIFTTDVEESHDILRHLADYVLISAGGAQDDIARGSRMARVAHSVYRDHCPGDPACREYSFMDSQRTPSPMMKRSLLYQLHSHNIKPGMKVDSAKFREVYRSQFNKIRIFKVLGVSTESKQWVLDRKNRICDAGNDWICRGQYPPALDFILSRKTEFEGDEEYRRDYMDALENPRRPKLKRAAPQSTIQSAPISFTPPPRSDIEYVYNKWEDSEHSSIMLHLIKSNDSNQVKSLLSQDSKLAFVRSKDGRGPMWWAFETGKEDIIRILKNLGVPHTDKDTHGIAPVDLNPDLSVKILNPKEYQLSHKKVLYNRREDSEQTELMHHMISSNNVPQVESLLNQDSKLAFVRSKDGRGPMWWAFQVGNEKIIKLLMDLGVPHTDKDANGIAPVDVDPDLSSKILNPKEYQKSEKRMLYNRWEDSEQTELMWKMISSNNVPQVESLLHQDSKLAFVRSKDGRGPMWWAYEASSPEIIKLLNSFGVPQSDKDSQGISPQQLLKGGRQEEIL